MMRVRTTVAVAILAVIPLAEPGSAQADPVPTCFGLPATIVGTSGPDELFGGPDDVIVGGGGNDTIEGAVVCGGPGDDYIFGLGWNSDDKLNGGDGDDYLNGYFGIDLILGGNGDDRLFDTDEDDDWPDYTDPGTDILRGGPGNDSLMSYAGSDRLFGEAGNDVLAENSRVKTFMSGGPGDDVVWAGGGDNQGTNPFEPDIVEGNGGQDTASVDRLDKVKDVIEHLTVLDWPPGP